MAQVPQSNQADLVIARGNAAKYLAVELSNEPFAVLQSMERMIFEAAVDDSGGDQTVVLNKYEAVLHDENRLREVMAAAKQEYTRHRSKPLKTRVAKGRSTSRSTRDLSPRSHTPKWGEVSAPPTWSVFGVLGGFSLLLTYNLGHRLLDIVNAAMVVPSNS